MKHLYTLLLLLLVAPAWATIGYNYAPQALPVQTECPLAAPFATRPEMVYAVSGDMQPFGVGAPATANGIRKAPPTTGTTDPDNPGVYLPVGDIDILCWSFLFLYIVLRPLLRKKPH